MSLTTFLSGLRRLTRATSFVTGNQSADMDSVISALSYAYLQHQHDPSVELVPLVNIPKRDLRLRRDIELLLKQNAIVEDQLFFLEDLAALTKEVDSVDVVLVDHCNVQGDLMTHMYNEGKLRIVGIVDHHADEGVALDAQPRIIEPTGLCSGLVFNYWFDKFPDKKVFDEVVPLLLGPLLIDTSNMTQKVEENDRVAYARYHELLVSAQSTELYQTLKAAKKDLSGFSFAELLRKDYKQFVFVTSKGPVSVGFSSLGKAFAWLLKTYTIEDIVATLSAVEADLGLDILVITTSYTQKESGQYTREFAYHYRRAEFASLAESLEGLSLDDNVYKREAVEGQIEHISRTTKLRVFNQGNTAASRKQVVPIVKTALERS